MRLNLKHEFSDMKKYYFETPSQNANNGQCYILYYCSSRERCSLLYTGARHQDRFHRIVIIRIILQKNVSEIVGKKYIL